LTGQPSLPAAADGPASNWPISSATASVNLEAGSYVNGDTLVSGNGALVFPEKGGLLRSDLKSKISGIEGDAFPADDPAFSMAVRPSGKDHRKSKSAHELVIFNNADPRPLITLRNLDDLTKDSKLPWSQRVHLIPRGKVLITLAEGGQRLILRNFDLAQSLSEEGIDYLFVESAPVATALRGTKYIYKLQVRSKKGGVHFELQSAPKGKQRMDQQGRTDGFRVRNCQLSAPTF
jgi:hypothetical protein